MSVKVWRVTHTDYASDAFSGEGARLYGGRFNSEGRPAVYSSESLSLSLLEVLIQIEDRDYLQNLALFYADIPSRLIWQPAPETLPDRWNRVPYGRDSQQFGDRWIKEENRPVLRVPSVVVPVEYNYVLNPSHLDFEKIKVTRATGVQLDERLSMVPGF